MKRIFYLIACISFMMSAISCSSDSDYEKTIALIVGTKSAYWDKVREGAIEEGEKQGLNVIVYHYPNDVAYDEVAEHITSLNGLDNLVGVAGLANEETLDAAYGKLRDDISIVVAEGVFINGGAVSKRYNGVVALNYEEYGTALTNHISESKILVISYNRGANSEIASVIIKNKGVDNVMVCPVADQRDVPAIITASLREHPDMEAVIFCSSNFVTDENLSLCGKRTIYSSDLNAAVAPFIRDGRIAMNISIDNYEFGANLVKAVADADRHKGSKSIVRYDIPFLITDKSNIDSPDRKRLYE